MAKINLAETCRLLVRFVKERVFLVECVFREGNRYTDLVQQQFAENFPETPCT
jgi:hypothetical protein